VIDIGHPFPEPFEAAQTPQPAAGAGARSASLHDSAPTESLRHILALMIPGCGNPRDFF